MTTGLAPFRSVVLVTDTLSRRLTSPVAARLNAGRGAPSLFATHGPTIVLLEAAFGLYLLTGGYRSGQGLHYVYGAIPAGAVLFGYSARTDDGRRGVHEHLMFGDGEVDLDEALSALVEVRYEGLVAVELPRHAHAAHAIVPRAMAALRAAEREHVDG